MEMLICVYMFLKLRTFAEFICRQNLFLSSLVLILQVKNLGSCFLLTIPFSLNHATDAKFLFNLDSGIMLPEVNEDPGFINLFCFSTLSF